MDLPTKADISEAVAKEPEHTELVNGDCWDEDTNDYLGRLTEELNEDLTTLPAQVSIYFQGYMYVFKPQSRYKYDPNEEKIDGHKET